MKEKDEVLNGILQSADRHPNSRVSKLIRLVESERTQKNIVMLLIELAENVEYATDFGISLKYYLDLFERLGLGRDIMLNETGLLLLNSSKIYSRRVDFVHELIERQILTLSNADREIAEAKNASETSSAPAPAEKPKRGRKRLLEAPKDPYEVTLSPKKFRKISHEKRFAVNSANAATVKANQVKLKSQMRHTETEQNIHPAGWLHSSIVDLENDEEIDSKRNYKLFTYHVEHRYNTLVPDINFRLHFMVKDFIDEEEEQLEEEFKESGHYPAERATTWPPLSEEYVEQYLQLENKLLKCGEQPRRKKANTSSKPSAETSNPEQVPAQENSEQLHTTDSAINIACSSNPVASEENLLQSNNDTHIAGVPPVETADIGQNDSGFAESISENNNVSAIEEVKDEKKDSSIACELVAGELNVEKKDNEENKNEKDANNEEIPKLESTLNNDKNEDKETTSNSTILDTSTNISNDAFNSTCINSSTISLNESANIDLSTSKINANESMSQTIDTSLNSLSLNSETDSALGSSIFDSSTLTSSLSQELESCSGKATSEKPNETLLSTEQTELNSTAPQKATEATTLLEDLLQSDAPTQELKSSSETSKSETQNETTLSTVQIDVNDSTALPEGTESKTLHGNLLPSDAAEHVSDKIDEDKLESSINLPPRKRGLHDDTQINLDEIRIHLPHLDDEGVFFSDLDEQDQRMLSPTVMALDVFPTLNNKKNFTIIVDDDIRAMLNITEDEPETYVMPKEKRSKSPVPIALNIMELPEKILRRRLLFKLGSEYDLYLQTRMCKRKRADETPREYRPPKQIKWFHLNDTDMSGVHVSPINSPGHSSADFIGFSDDDDSVSEFHGFPEDDQTIPHADHEVCHRLSRDSGVDGVDGPTTIDRTSLSVIVEEEPEQTQQITENLTKTEENIAEAATNGSTNDCSVKNTEVISSESIPMNSTSNVINLQTEDQKEKIESTTEQVLKEAQIDGSITNATIIVETSSAVIGDSGQDLNTTNAVVFSVQEITEAQNLDDLLNDDVNQLAADVGVEETCIVSADNAHVEQNVGDSETQIGVVTRVERELDNTIDDIELNSSKTKIQKWHEHLQPILSKSRERHHFDVFQIGTEIMNELEQHEQTHEEDVSCRSITFQDVMENKDASYVSRYFLSSLLLANQSNIQITVANKSSEEPTAWQDIQFDLLSTKRHTVSIEDNIGMVHKASVSEKTPKLKTAAIPPLKRAAKNSSSKYDHYTDLAAPASSASTCYSMQTLQQDSQICQLVNVNLDIVKPLKHIEKLPRNGDDYDSGIFSSEELM